MKRIMVVLDPKKYGVEGGEIAVEVLKAPCGDTVPFVILEASDVVELPNA